METGMYLVPLVLVLSSLDACPAARRWALNFGDDWDAALDACNQPDYLIWLMNALIADIGVNASARRRAMLAMAHAAFPEAAYADFRASFILAHTGLHDRPTASLTWGRDERTAHWLRVAVSSVRTNEAVGVILGLRTALRVEKKMSYRESQVVLARALRISMGDALLDGLKRYADLHGITRAQ